MVARAGLGPHPGFGGAAGNCRKVAAPGSKSVVGRCPATKKLQLTYPNLQESF
jgi:hypothetical protein